ncbi:general substrate transporter [Linderina pennispora]|uniref:General substrate transporter n=1 Tax=Linderina pennispora TaxID=61395 RepID=A0A1Y1WH98_9FUNG|nr:general substrate transporter [Linderina pennispora]ORX72494.1 general substrate transporter [Linderina pennispora]
MGRNAQAYFVGGISALGGLLFGYDIGVMSSILEMDQWKNYFHHPLSTGVGVITSILTAGCFVGSLCAGYLADKLSRKRTIMAASLVFILGAVIQTASINRGMLITGRFIAGLGVGTLSMVVPVYQSEVAPPAIRGRLVSLQQWSITWGILIAFWIDYGCHFIKSNASWRLAPGYPNGACTYPVCRHVLHSLLTPLAHVDNDRFDEARKCLARLRAGGDENDPADIKEAVRLERETVVRSYTELAKYPIRRRVSSSGVVIQALQQLTGINVIMYFAPSIFKQSGLSSDNASLLAQGCRHLAPTQNKEKLSDGSVDLHLPKGISYLVIVMVYLFVISFAASWGPVGWIYPAEIFPMHIRSRASSIATASNWLFNFVVRSGCTYPDQEDHMGS